MEITLPPKGSLEAPPCSFAALMELCEINYIYMRRLAPDLRTGFNSGGKVSVSRHGVELCLEVLECSRYTTTTLLTHRFQGADGNREAIPDLTVRVYHDARVAEVIEMGGGGARYASLSLAKRWAENRFLNRWLLFSLGEGHSFDLG
ncbi:DUF1249 domain-containing protein [Halorhodospira halochloris]|nr:DUF1249 domain-containing protein [Halorhodospira halochloris]MBK1651118.1 hypothetical protein [Halorhodospira halochloris]MCG5547728.1 DUF1249 domain-containing protein [Halorhodospira halochloris]